MAIPLAELRRLAPKRPLSTLEAMWVAERQATRLLDLSNVTAPPVPETIIANLQRVRLEKFDGERVGGFYESIGGRWVIAVNAKDAPVRRRYTTLHEGKHVIDGKSEALMYPPHFGLTTRDRSERMANYFAACVLMPKTWLKRDWAAGLQDPERLADRFDVSQVAMIRRLEQLGLIDRAAQCGNYPEAREAA
ncbi:MAG TPA: ImmA/IrrE family metallo-endopeptidase [Candidatus Angelobacter sp.]|nr:ImmA/IrrE family metallo-endopeptidase [Candidatus Angelobacter sp.]